MASMLATALIVGLIVWLLWRDLKQRPGVSVVSWLALLWIVTVSSRPISTWFGSTAGTQTPDAYLEGNPVERLISLTLIAAAAIFLVRRRVSLASVLARNAWLFVFFGYCLASVVWSDYPFVAFKRWFRDFGNVLIVLLIVTEKDPTEALAAVFVRCAYILVPLSFLFVRYYPEIGRIYGGWNNDERMLVGVTWHKNTLGALLLISVLFLLWDLLRNRARGLPVVVRFGSADRLLVLWMAASLLLIANSATSLACCVLGVGIFLAVRPQFVRRRMRFVEVYLAFGAGFWFLLDYAFNLKEVIIQSLGRDTTLTTRTDAWDFVLSQVENPLLGAGFKSFWSGERMVRLWVELPGIVQAHSGYVETYLNGGYIGLALLGAAMLAGLAKIKRGLIDTSEGNVLAPLQFALWCVALVYNYSEAAFNQLSLLWVVTLVAVIKAPELGRMPAIAAAASPFVKARVSLSNHANQNPAVGRASRVAFDIQPRGRNRIAAKGLKP